MTNQEINKTVHVIIGPTASGKSAFALKKAKETNGVVINCDAMQSYNALHVLTAQPSIKEQEGIPHHLYGHLHPATHYSAADWQKDAIDTINAAWDNDKTPIICGGTGFYLKALMEGLSPIPDIPNNVREKAIALQKEMGNPAFHEKLKEKDPETGEVKLVRSKPKSAKELMMNALDQEIMLLIEEAMKS